MPKLTDDEQEKLLVECREDYSYAKAYWQENYEEAEKDMDCVLCVPPDEFVKDREGKPCIWPDETSQYVNQINNNLRQNKRSIKLSPRGMEATDQDAEHRQAYIRGIEYASKAQSIYSTAFESCVECGFGYWRLNLEKTGPKELEPRIRRIPNWATVWPDPDAREADFSDSMLYFVMDTMRESTFARKYPKATKKSFTSAEREKVPGWFFGDNLTVAEWWKRKPSEEEEDQFLVTQYITNGLEILEVNDWVGSWIPIIGCFGAEKFQRKAGQSKRVFLSAVRRARSAAQMMAYIASKEAEEFGMTTAAPYFAWKGMIDSKLGQDMHRINRAWIDLTVPKDWMPAWGAPPFPSRTPFTPNTQEYEVAYERWRRSHQSAMGIAPLPTAAQRQNQKSGVALEKIQDAEAIGAFHFTDNFVRSLCNTGMQIDELITKLAESNSLPKKVLGKDQKDEDRMLEIVPRDGQPQQGQDHLPEADQFFAHRGRFTVTISDGPSYKSQREEASSFSDTLLQVLPSLGLPPNLVQEVLAIAIKLKNIGALGDELSELLAPPDQNNLPPQAKAVLAQATGQIQQLQAMVTELQQERQGKVIEGQFKVWAEQIKAETAKAVAEINTKSQQLSERIAAIEELEAQLHGQAHERGMQAEDHAHETALAAQQAEAARQQQAEGAAQQAALQPPAQAQPGQ